MSTIAVRPLRARGVRVELVGVYPTQIVSAHGTRDINITLAHNESLQLLAELTRAIQALHDPGCPSLRDYVACSCRLATPNESEEGT